MMKKYFVSIIFILLLICISCKDDSNTIKVISHMPEGPTLVGDIYNPFPLVTDDTSMNILTVGFENNAAEDTYVWKKYEEMTGIKVNWTTTIKGNRKNEVQRTLANKLDIDLIIRCKISAADQNKYGKNGLIYNLNENDMLEKYAPNCWKYLQTHPDALASVMNPDGSIYSIPQINSGAELRVSRKIFINKNWLESLNLSVPKTNQEFYEMLKAFKENDGNNNGIIGDEIPLCSADFLSLQESFYGSFGLANRGVHNMMIDYDKKTGKARFIQASDEYKQFLQYFNKLYEEELLDKYTFSITNPVWLNNIENNLVGVFASTNLATLPADNVDDWIAIEKPLIGPNGDNLFSAVRANFHSTGAAVIPKTCENPELVLKWLDYFWTDEGTLFYHLGIENETFVVKDDNTFDYTDEILKQINESNSFDDVISKYSPYPGGGNPTVEIAPYFMGGEMATIPANAAKKLFEYGPEEYWPVFTFTDEETEILNTYQSYLVDEYSRAYESFISGTKPFDEWNNYLQRLDKLDKDKVIQVYQNAIDRYNELKYPKK